MLPHQPKYDYCLRAQECRSQGATAVKRRDVTDLAQEFDVVHVPRHSGDWQLFRCPGQARVIPLAALVPTYARCYSEGSRVKNEHADGATFGCRRSAIRCHFCAQHGTGQASRYAASESTLYSFPHCMRSRAHPHSLFPWLFLCGKEDAHQYTYLQYVPYHSKMRTSTVHVLRLPCICDNAVYHSECTAVDR